MADIGYMGDIPFIVSSWKTRTIDKYTRKGTPRYSTHDIMGHKPRLEFIGPDAEEVSFTMKLSIQLGVHPLKELERLRKKRDTGEVMNLFLGRRPVSQQKWVITELSESVIFFDKQGGIIAVDVSITMKEYMERPIKQIQGVRGEYDGTTSK